VAEEGRPHQDTGDEGRRDKSTGRQFSSMPASHAVTPGARARGARAWRRTRRKKIRCPGVPLGANHQSEFPVKLPLRCAQITCSLSIYNTESDRLLFELQSEFDPLLHRFPELSSEETSDCISAQWISSAVIRFWRRPATHESSSARFTLRRCYKFFSEDLFTGKIAHPETSESLSGDGELSSLATGCQIKRAGEFLVVSFPLYFLF
jgi:hypothetical protein